MSSLSYIDILVVTFWRALNREQNLGKLLIQAGGRQLLARLQAGTMQTKVLNAYLSIRPLLREYGLRLLLTGQSTHWC